MGFLVKWKSQATGIGGGDRIIVDLPTALYSAAYIAKKFFQVVWVEDTDGGIFFPTAKQFKEIENTNAFKKMWAANGCLWDM